MNFLEAYSFFEYSLMIPIVCKRIGFQWDGSQALVYINDIQSWIDKIC